MHQRKSKKIIFYFFLLVSISSITNISLNSFKFNKIQNIKISGLDEKNNSNLLKEIKSINIGNIFFTNKKKINELIKSNNLIEKYEVIKEYPSTIKIKIQKTNFLARIKIKDKNFYIGSNGKLILDDNKYNHLPFIFGQPEVKEFLKFKSVVDESRFSYSEFESLYFFPSKRWDVKLKNNTYIKLSKNFSKENLDNLYEFLEDNNMENISTVDTRIKNQIILND